LFACSCILLFLLLPPSSPRLPYTTLVRSADGRLLTGHGFHLHGAHFQHQAIELDTLAHDLPPQPQFFDAARPLTGYLQQGCQKQDRKSTRLNSSHVKTSYAVFCWKKNKSE